MRQTFEMAGPCISARAAVLGSVILAVFLSLSAWPAAGRSGQARERPNRIAANPLVKPGEFPPDFDLPRLTFATDAAGKSVGLISQSDRIRLSAFRGKKPVCLILSSYT